MSKEKVCEIQRENKKAFGKFIVIMIMSTLIGAIVGMLTAKLPENSTEAIARGIMAGLHLITPYANLVIVSVGTIVVTVLFKISKQRFKTWNGEDEDEMERIDRLLSYAIYITTMIMILACFFFAAGMKVFQFVELREDAAKTIPVVCWFVSFILVLVFVTVSQRILVDFLKQINPEKKGSIYDIKFTKKWEESCDEAERLQIYKAGYKSYPVTSMTCLVLWIVCLMGSVIWDFGLMPVAMVTVVWTVLTTSYTWESMRVSKRNK
ncbi:MAG: DUF3169 family protein [bacterium]|nr:DUF3169 family protein [bacterium]